MNVVYRVRHGERNEPLRYSLRSLANLGDGRHDVLIVGSAPRWVHGVEVVAGRRTGKWRALVDDLLAISRSLTGEFVLIDDDQYVLGPTWIPTVHRGPLRAHAVGRAGTYGRTLVATADYLVERCGIDEPLSYELHLPMLVDAGAMVDALERLVYSVRPLQARSVYGNVHSIGGTESEDVKVTSRGGVLPYPFASTSPGSFRWYVDRLRVLLPEPSAYE